MVACRGMCKLLVTIKEVQQNKPQTSLVPKAAWHGPCRVIRLVPEGALG